MRRGRIFIFLALILIVGLLLVALVVRQFLVGGFFQATPTPSLVRIFVAAQKIPLGATITEDVLTTIEKPQDKVSNVEFTEAQLGELLGKVARFEIDAGVTITRPMVADSAAELAPSGPEHAAVIPPGMVAKSIPTSRLTSVAYGVGDGSHVNLNGCFLFVDLDPSFQTVLPNYTAVLTGTGFVPDQLPVLSVGVISAGATSPQGRVELDPSLQQPFYIIGSEPQRPRLVCQMVLQNILVLKYGNFSLPGAAEAAQQQEGAAAQAPPPDIITLIVSPQDSVTLDYLIYSGAELTLALRNPTDESRMATEAATLQYLLSQYNIPIPAKLPYGMVPRLDEITPPFMPNDVITVPPE